MTSLNIQYFIVERLMGIALMIVGIAFVVCLLGAAGHIIRNRR